MKAVSAALSLTPIVILAVIAAALAPFFAGSFSAYAADTPHIAVSGDVWLLNGEGSRLFMLPDTYYARINNLDESFYYVTFNGVSGKVDKNTVSAIGYHTTAPGTMRDITISSDYAEFTAINLKAKPDLGAENSAEVPVGQSITFLGEYPAESGIWYYVKYEQFYGYIRADRTSMPVMEIPVFVPEEPPEAETSAPETPSGDETDKTVLDVLDDKELKIVIIVGLAVPAVAVVILLFRSRGGKKERERYED